MAVLPPRASGGVTTKQRWCRGSCGAGGNRSGNRRAPSGTNCRCALRELVLSLVRSLQVLSARRVALPAAACPLQCFPLSAFRGGNEPPRRGLLPRDEMKQDFAGSFAVLQRVAC